MTLATPKRRIVQPLTGSPLDIDPSILYPVSQLIVEEERRRQEALWNNPTPGLRMPDNTIHLGGYSPVDYRSNSLGKKFNVFAAPVDLPHPLKYVDLVQYVGTMPKWHGYAGTVYETDKQLIQALKDEKYDGGWIIPPCEILYGKDIHGNGIVPEHLFMHQDTGAFHDTFAAFGFVPGSNILPNWYWSSTESWSSASETRSIRIRDGSAEWSKKDMLLLSCRLVRLVEVKL